MQMDSRLGCVPRDEWRLHGCVDGSRRKRLLRSTGFEKIIKQIITQTAKNVQPLFHKRSAYRNKTGFYRIKVCINISPVLVDLFHNSRCGYRAQYYLSEENGECANRYTIMSLMPILEEKLSGNLKRSIFSWEWAKLCPVRAYGTDLRL